MKTTAEGTKALLTVFTQFWRPCRAYRLLLDTRTAGFAMIASVLVISAAGYAPALFIDWNEFQSEWMAGRVPELVEQGMTPAAADSTAADELAEIKQMTASLPMARLLERGIIGLVAALAAFGIVYALEGGKFGRFRDYLTSSILSQAAYMLSGVTIVLLVSILDISPGTRLNLSVLVPVGTMDPSRIHVFLFRFLENVDLPSVVCLVLWGMGLSAMLDRERSWGIRLVFSVYVLGILLIALPVMFAPAA